MEQPELQLLGHLSGDERRLVGGKRYDVLLLLEIAVGLLGVVDGRHKVRPVVTSCQKTAVGSEVGKAGFPVLTRHHQHTKHLATVGIFPDVGMCRDILLHLLSS